jgi:phosphoribosyl 1,2-cyclic phosphodiesterase
MLAVGDPIHNRNYRNNPSLIISLANHNNESNKKQTVIIDVGKTFREGALRWLPKYGIHGIDAIILTHQHMDAAAGLDDVRGFQQYRQNPEPGQRPIQVPMPLYLSQHCIECLQEQFPFLFPKSKDPEGPGTISQEGKKPVVARHVASFDTHVFQDFKPFEPLPGFQVTPLPVMHGEDLISYGFAFTIEDTNVVYLSDISRMLPETLEYIQSSLPQPTHILVLDALLLDGTNPTHFNLQDAIALTKQIHPLQTLLVGMNCDSFLPHDETNERLQSEFGNIKLAHDGQIIEISKTKA